MPVLASDAVEICWRIVSPDLFAVFLERLRNTSTMGATRDSLLLLCACLVILTGRSEASSAVVVDILVSNADPEIARESQKARDTLRKCGYSVIEINASDLSQIEQQLAKYQLPQGVLINISGHSRGVNDSNETKEKGAVAFLRSEDIRHLGFFDDITQTKAVFNDSQLQDVLLKYVTRPRLFVDVCYGGWFKARPGVSVAVTSGWNQMAPTKAYVRHSLNKLLCSAGPQGDCEEWSKADPGGTGKLSREHLDLYIDKELSHLRDPRHQVSAERVVEEIRVMPKSKQKLCQYGPDSKVTEGKFDGFEMEITFLKNEKTERSTFQQMVGFRKDLAPRLEPLGFFTASRKATAEALVVQSCVRRQLACQIHWQPISFPTVHCEYTNGDPRRFQWASGMYFSPQFRNFTLTAPHCRQTSPEPIPRSGLGFRYWLQEQKNHF